MESKATKWRNLIFAFIGAAAGVTTCTGLSTKDLYHIFLPQQQEGCVIPNFQGMDYVKAKASINNLGLKPIIQNIREEKIKIGTVISQFPPKETILKECSGEIILQVSAEEIVVKNTPVEYPATPSQVEKSALINPWRILAWSVIIILIIYMFYKLTEMI